MTSTDTDAFVLPPLPPTFLATRTGLHRVAEQIVAVARKPENEIALESTPGGFGTPTFEHDGIRQRVRVDAAELVYERGGDAHRAPLGSLRAAAELVSPLLSEPPNDDEPLNVDPTAAEALARWYELGDRVLRQLVADAAAEDAASPVSLWPEHFDIAIELGSEAAGVRANYGFSPGDAEHAEPYAYVGPWGARVEGALWQARGFRGAELAYAELLATDDPVAAALEFCRTRKAALMAMAMEVNR